MDLALAPSSIERGQLDFLAWEQTKAKVSGAFDLKPLVLKCSLALD
jgi:hypothetical protein